MDITDRSNIGYTFWLVSGLRNESEYNLLTEKIYRENYRINDPDTFIITDETSRNAIPSSYIQEIPISMILNEDSSIYSIISTMGTKHVLMIVSDEKATDTTAMMLKRSLAVLITRQFGDTRCTLITESVSVLNTMRDRKWESLMQGDRPLSIEALSTLRGIQFSKGIPITTLYRLTSYILSCLNWDDDSLVAAGVAHVSEVSPDIIEPILSKGSSSKGEPSWDIHGYVIVRVDRMNGYNFYTPGLSSILSSLGKRSYKIYSPLLKGE